jgi:hypothetical protein
MSLSDARCRIGALLALEAASHRRHGCLPVPDLAFRAIAMSAVRHLHITCPRHPSMTAGMSAAEAVAFLHTAPLNMSRLRVHDSDVLLIAAALDGNRCHELMTHLCILVRKPAHRDGLGIKASNALVDATHGLPHLRVLTVLGPGAGVMIAAARRTLRHINVRRSRGAHLDLGEHAALRRLSLIHCFGLTDITLPCDLTRLDGFELSMCNGVTHLDFSHTRLALCGARFLFRASVRSVALPPTLSCLGHQAFSDCRLLQQLDLSHTCVATVGDDFLRDAVSLTDVALPASLRTLGYGAFKGCVSLTALDAEHTALVTVGDDFVRECAALAAVVLPRSLTAIGCTAFAQCDQLRCVNMSHAELESVGEGTSIPLDAYREN